MSTLMPHIHFISGIIVGLLLNLHITSSEAFILFIIGNILPDIDILMGFYLKTNHRTFITHYISFYLFMAILSYMFLPTFFWLVLGGIVHVLIDIIDWGVYPLAPFSNHKISLFDLDYNEISSSKTFLGYLKNYYNTSSIIKTEVVVVLISIVVILAKFLND